MPTKSAWEFDHIIDGEKHSKIEFLYAENIFQATEVLYAKYGEKNVEEIRKMRFHGEE